MGKKEALEILYDRVMNNVFNYSDNYLMSIPKKGCEKEWEQERELADTLREMLEEV